MSRAGGALYGLQDVAEEGRRTFLLRPGTNRVGTLPGSEIRLEARGVSKRHALVIVDAESVWVEDLASKNGTFVNRRAVDAQAVGAGDLLHFGPVALRLARLEGGDGELAIVLGEDESRVHAAAPGPETSRIRRPGGAPGAASPADGLVFPPDHVRGAARPMRDLYRQLADAATADLPLLLLGETGTGKEGLARIAHASSRRAGGPFVAINCAAIPGELLEAELFGIARAVATGVDERPGKFRLAAGGTLFLDEIGDMPRELQAKLLRAVEEKEIHPLGGAPVGLDARLVAATNSDLTRRVEQGAFRHDLYYRLAGFVLRLPPLRERREDVPRLVEHFVRRAAGEAGKRLRGVTAGALERLVARPWPGNVRQLEFEVGRLVQLCPDGQPLSSALLDRAAAGDLDPAPPGLDLRLAPDLDLEALEKQALEEALRRTGGNQSRAAPLLGLSREALRRRLKRHGLWPLRADSY